ncbi:MAG TPA: IS1182 family transposase [Solirubrobacteraceae bacterium]|nr:IS1182 family transposase [Solirubrobacteraceae bacterium]
MFFGLWGPDASDSQGMLEGMSLGLTPMQADVFTTTGFCESRVSRDSIYGLLHRECFRLFPDEMFADLFADSGRNCVPPMIVAVVMVLQRIEGCSDREAVDRFAFDARWKYAAGGLSFDYPSFVHTVLVDMRARLAGSERPGRIFEVVLEMAKQAGLVGRRRVLDSTALYDAVATMDTVTLIRSAIRGLLGACEGVLEDELRGLLARDDDYRTAGKPVCDYEDRQAREELIDALAKDARALLGALDGRELSAGVSQAAALLATVVGQDLDEGADGVFRVARRVAKDRVISTVDPDARHGHKTSARGFDGYKGHAAVDPDSELITATTVTAGNVGDGQAVEALLASELAVPDATDPPEEGSPARPGELLSVYGDSAYGAGSVLDTLEQADVEIMCKVQPPNAPAGRYAKDAFGIDLTAGTVTCPAGQIAELRPIKNGHIAHFGHACQGCPLADRCTTSAEGRSIHVGLYEQQLTRARARQTDPAWKADYTATRPKVERKISHLMRRRHGGRRARVRGHTKVDADFNLLAAAVNLARLATLSVTHHTEGWAASTA